MLAARDQENLIHARQQATAAKPLNQGPKTPGPQGAVSTFTQRPTARRIGKGDENKTPAFTGKKIAAGDRKAAFLTPAPATRAPLGAKTTNARARPLQTPGPQTTKPQIWTKTRPPSASARRTKLKIHHQSEDAIIGTHLNDAREDSDTDSVPDIESCPSKAVDLPDYPDPNDSFEIKPDEDFSMFSKQNYFRGVWDVYGRKRSDGLTDAEGLTRRLDEIEQHLDAQPAVTSSDDLLELERTPNSPKVKGKASDRTVPVQPPTASSNHNRLPKEISSRNAADCLGSSGDTSTARYARPTLATQARNPSKTLGQLGKAASGPSKNTIGYSKGRKIGPALNKPNGPGGDWKGDNKLVSKSGEELVEELCRRQFYEEHSGQDLFDNHLGIDFDPLADEFKDFQLEVL